MDDIKPRMIEAARHFLSGVDLSLLDGFNYFTFDSQGLFSCFQHSPTMFVGCSSRFHFGWVVTQGRQYKIGWFADHELIKDVDCGIALTRDELFGEQNERV